MKNIAVISILTWMLFRLSFHAFSFDNSDITTFLYFGGNSFALVGLFALLHNYTRGVIQRLIKVSLIYSIFCLSTDILMLFGIGAHDFWLYTAISISIIALGGLWLVYV